MHPQFLMSLFSIIYKKIKLPVKKRFTLSKHLVSSLLILNYHLGMCFNGDSSLSP